MMAGGERRSFAVVAALLALTLMASGLLPSGAAAARGAMLTIHNRLCPEGYRGGNYFRDCHGTPAAGTEFEVRGAESAGGRTDRQGNLTFELDRGRYTVRGGVPGDFARLNVFCASADTPGTRFPFREIGGGVRGAADPTGIRIRLAAGDDVICDWYNTPESQRG